MRWLVLAFYCVACGGAAADPTRSFIDLPDGGDSAGGIADARVDADVGDERGDGEPSDAAGDGEVVDAVDGEPECALSKANYDTTCTSDSDCVNFSAGVGWVSWANQCTSFVCACWAPDAVNQRSLAQYRVDAERLQMSDAAIGLPCPSCPMLTQTACCRHNECIGVCADE